MAKSYEKKKAKLIEAVHSRGCLLVYPIDNQPLPKSLWSELYPRSRMVWEWDADSDGRVSELWILREELSRSAELRYVKWYKQRATFFAPDVFVHLLALFESSRRQGELSRSSQEALESFLMDSPQSTKLIKENLGWQGKLMESHYNRALKPLWSYLYIVGYGEVQDSSFPSLNMAASATLFEKDWLAAQEISVKDAGAYLKRRLGEESPFYQFALKLQKNLSKR